MNYRLALAISITFALLAGCNSKPKNEPSPPQLPQIIIEKKQALDNAKTVDDTIAKQAEDQRKQIEEATK